MWHKKTFYVLRPLLTIRWIEREGSPVPIEFHRLVESTVEDGALLEAIETLLEEKRAGLEMGRGPRVPFLSEFIEKEFARFDSALPELPKVEAPIEKLNELFRDTLAEDGVRRLSSH